jgi:hypothetical protein
VAVVWAQADPVTIALAATTSSDALTFRIESSPDLEYA